MVTPLVLVLAQPSQDPPTSGIGGVVTGALVALVSAVVIPFLTTQFSLWSESRRQSFATRQAAIAAVIDAESAVLADRGKQVDARYTAGASGTIEESRYLSAKVTAARRQVEALFTTSDRQVMRALASDARPSGPTSPYLSAEILVVLSTWARGRQFRAARAARRFLRSSG